MLWDVLCHTVDCRVKVDKEIYSDSLIMKIVRCGKALCENILAPYLRSGTTPMELSSSPNVLNTTWWSLTQCFISRTDTKSFGNIHTPSISTRMTVIIQSWNHKNTKWVASPVQMNAGQTIVRSHQLWKWGSSPKEKSMNNIVKKLTTCKTQKLSTTFNRNF